MPQNSHFVKDPPATSLRDSNDALTPVYWRGKSFMLLDLSPDIYYSLAHNSTYRQTLRE